MSGIYDDATVMRGWYRIGAVNHHLFPFIFDEYYDFRFILFYFILFYFITKLKLTLNVSSLSSIFKGRPSLRNFSVTQAPWKLRSCEAGPPASASVRPSFRGCHGTAGTTVGVISSKSSQGACSVGMACCLLSQWAAHHLRIL